MPEKASDIDKDNDVTTTIFQAFKKAEPIIILASISLAIAALVVSQDKYLTIFNFSIIASFMFIFSFGFYVSYELIKKYWYPTKGLKPDEYSDAVFYYSMMRFAPIYFAVIGIIFLFVIAYNFGTDLTKFQALPQPSQHQLPIFLLAGLFFISYFFVYLIYTIIKSLIIWKNSLGTITKKNLTAFLITKSIIFFFLLLLELYIFAELMGYPKFINNQDLLKYSYYILVSVGAAVIVKRVVIDSRFFTDFKKRKTKYTVITLTISIFVLLLVPLAILGVLQGIGVLDKNFDIFEYAINASRNILPHGNQSSSTLTMK